MRYALACLLVLSLAAPRALRAQSTADNWRRMQDLMAAGKCAEAAPGMNAVYLEMRADPDASPEAMQRIHADAAELKNCLADFAGALQAARVAQRSRIPEIFVRAQIASSIALEWSGDAAGAGRELEKALQTENPAQRTRALVARGDRHLLYERLDAAQADYAAALAADPALAAAHLGLARVMILRGDRAGAARELNAVRQPESAILRALWRSLRALVDGSVAEAAQAADDYRSAAGNHKQPDAALLAAAAAETAERVADPAAAVVWWLASRDAWRSLESPLAAVRSRHAGLRLRWLQDGIGPAEEALAARDETARVLGADSLTAAELTALAARATEGASALALLRDADARFTKASAEMADAARRNRLLYAERLASNGQHAQAVQIYERVPDAAADPRFASLIGQSRLELGQFADAARAFERAGQTPPGVARRLAEAFDVAGNGPEALAWWKRCLGEQAGRDEFPILKRVAELGLSAGDYASSAAALARIAADATPVYSPVELRTLQARAAHGLGRVDEEVGFLTMAAAAALDLQSPAEAQALLARARSALKGAPPAELLLAEGDLALVLFNKAEAESALQQAERLAPASSRTHALAVAGLARLDVFAGRLAEAHAKAWSLAEGATAADPRIAAEFRSLKAALATADGNDAAALYQEIESNLQRLDSPSERALVEYAGLLERRQQTDAVERLYTQMMAVADRSGDGGRAAIRTALRAAEYYGHRRNFDRAESLLDRARRASVATPERYRFRSVLEASANLAVVAGRVGDAAQRYRELLDLPAEAGEDACRTRGSFLTQLGQLEIAQDHSGEARTAFQSAARLCEGAGTEAERALALARAAAALARAPGKNNVRDAQRELAELRARVRKAAADPNATELGLLREAIRVLRLPPPVAAACRLAERFDREIEWTKPRNP